MSNIDQPNSKSVFSGLFTGVAFVFLFALLASGLALVPPFSTLSFSPLIIGMVLGMAYANLPRRILREDWVPGIQFSAKKILRLAIVLYGFRLTFQNIYEVGLSGIAVSLLMVGLTFAIGVVVGVRVLKLDRDLSILVASGAAICGAAAVLATESVIKAKAWKSTVAVATVVLFGTLAMFAYPFFYSLGLIPFGPQEMGIYIGGSVHEVAHVVAAGNAIDAPTGDSAVIVKMIRVMMLAPFLLLLGLWFSASGGDGDSKIHIPWFAVLFIVMAGFNSLHLLPGPVVNQINIIDGFLLTMAMSALGLETSIAKFKGVGMRPIWLALILFVWLIFGGFFITKYTMMLFGG